MQNEDIPQNQTTNQNRTINDVFGVGEAIKAIFSFFTKIVEKLPFTKITPAQTQFILIFIVVNLLGTVLLFMGKIDPIAMYIILGFDIIMGYKTYDLANAKSDRK